MGTRSIRFLGVGDARAHELGQSCAVYEENDHPVLMIDCGPSALSAFENAYGEQLPPAIYITHLHLDHIGGLETLFYLSCCLSDQHVKLIVPTPLVAGLHQRMADTPAMLAEGGVNFWDVFQLIPVNSGFWLQQQFYHVFPTRHHAHNTAFGLALKGCFIFTGDTRPIPEILNCYACQSETIFHDCGVEANPSHTGLQDLPAHYRQDHLNRMVLYHYGSLADGQYMQSMGYRIARKGEVFDLDRNDSHALAHHGRMAVLHPDTNQSPEAWRLDTGT